MRFGSLHGVEPGRRAATTAGPAGIRAWRVRAIASLAVLAVAIAAAHAERLPLTPYSARDGLLDDGVRRIVCDRGGRLWFVHRTGLSRLDGPRFERYGPASGLPRGRIRDLLQTRAGALLVATDAGFYRLAELATPPRFVPVRAPGAGASAFALAEDARGTAWGATVDGLCRFAASGGELDCIPALRDEVRGPVQRLAASAGGGLFVQGDRRVAYIAPEGRAIALPASIVPPPVNVMALAAAPEGDGAWVGTTAGLVYIDPHGRVEPVPLVGEAESKACVFAVVGDGPRAAWVATDSGLFRLEGGARRRVFRYTAAHGLPQSELTALARDGNGQLWIGTESTGVIRLATDGFTSWTESEGIGNPRIASIFTTRDGVVHLSAGTRLYRHEGDRFVEAGLGMTREALGWGWYQWVFQDREGDWWVPSRRGLLRFRGLTRIEDLARAQPAEIVAGDLFEQGGSVFRLYEDAAGDVWIGTIGEIPRPRVAVYRRATRTLESFTTAHGFPAVSATAFREDRSGAMWIGFYDGGVGRLRGGRMTFFPPGVRVPPGQVRALHLDARGRLWIATEAGGVALVESPEADAPRFSTLTTADGLSSDLVASITDDDAGRLYFGTDHGIDRFDPDTRAIRHYHEADGLPSGFVNAAFRDASGALWFGTLHGVARLRPDAGPTAPVPVPQAVIRQVRVAGEPWPVSAFGATELDAATFDHGADRVVIEYSAVAPGRRDLRFQYRLDDALDAWSAPSPQESVEFAALAPGRYRFSVRAVDPAGRPGEKAAQFAFTVRAPLWRTGWFAGLCALAVACAGYGVHRVRLARAVEMERIRTRIASDLHDDIGATLSRMAILLDALQQRTGDGEVRSALGRIAEAAREAVDSMSDIVWAINPRRDRMGDLAGRMRRFATEAADAAGIAFDLDAPEEPGMRLGPDLKRDLLLLFKEAVNNAVRHARCGRIEAALAVDGAAISLRVRDDGVGFDPAALSDGNGLSSMARRAAARGGSMDLSTRPGDGATVSFAIPLAPRG